MNGDDWKGLYELLKAERDALAAERDAALARVVELEAGLREVEKYSQLGIDNDTAARIDATDHIRVREIARSLLTRTETPFDGTYPDPSATADFTEKSHAP